MSSAQRQALHTLSTDKAIVSKQADKGGALVIMNRSDYEKECLSQLTNKKFYEELLSDPKITQRKIINETVDKMHHARLITDFESEKMKEGNRTPCFYDLTKLHNSFFTFPSLRPICSGSNSCTVHISEFVDHFLKPIAQKSFSYVKDTTAFINKLDNTQINNLNNATLVSIDLNSLYPNTDHEEGAEACYEYPVQYDTSPLLSKFLLRLIYLVLKCNTLSLGSRFFHQIKGTAMGTSVAVNFANLFMTIFESEMLRDFEAANGIRPAL